MTTSAETTEQTEALVERLFGAAIDTLELASVHIGGQLGFYRALAEGGDATPGELAARTGTAERYSREWLEQQAVAGFLAVDDPDAGPGERRYGLPAAHRSVLVEEEDLSYLAPLAPLALGVLRPIDALLEAYRTGGGVPYARLRDPVEAIGALNRPQFVHLTADWLASIPEVDTRLRRRPAGPRRRPRLRDGLVQHRDRARVPDGERRCDRRRPESIATATRNVAAAGLADRVRPVVHDASDPELPGRYDLVTLFEALHDMNHPVEALRRCAASLSADGSPWSPTSGWPSASPRRATSSSASTTAAACCTAWPSACSTRTPPARVLSCARTPCRAYASEAGFGRVEVLPIEHDFWRFYRLVP